MFKKQKATQSGFAMVEIIIFLIVIVAIGGIGYWRLSSSGASSIDPIEDSSELADEELMSGSSSAVALSSVGTSNKAALIDQFNMLTISNLTQIGGAATARGSSLTAPSPTSNYVKNKNAVFAAEARYLYYFDAYMEPYVSMYSSLRKANINTVNIGVIENGTRVNYPTTKEQYIKYAVDLADIVTTQNLFDYNKDGMKEWRWNPMKSSPTVTTCRGRDKVVVNQLCALRTTKSLSYLAATIKSNSVLNAAYGANADNYVKFIKKNILDNYYYKSEYDPAAKYSHNNAIFLNSQAANTLLNMYIASGKTIAAEAAYLNDAKTIASNLRKATLNATMNNKIPPEGTIYLGVNKLCDTLTDNLAYYNLFQDYTSKNASDGNGHFSCQAADTSHLNAYMQMVANFKNNGYVFGDYYVNKLVNTLNNVMWKEWVDPSLPNAKLAIGPGYKIYPPFKSDLTVNVSSINTIKNYLYKSNIDWPKQNALVGKQIVVTCPSLPAGTFSKDGKVVNVTGNTNTSITLSGMAQLGLTKDTLCTFVLYDKAYYDASGNATGRIIHNQFSDFSNGYNLTISKNHDNVVNPKYSPGSLGQNFAEWNSIISIAPASNPNTALLKAKAAKSFTILSADAQTFYLTQAINW